MKSLVLAAALLALAGPAWAGQAQIVRHHPNGRTDVPSRMQHTVQSLDAVRLDHSRSPLAAKGGGVLLTCENDGTIDGALIIGIGDFVGNVFAVPEEPTPWMVKSISFALLDFDATYPGLLFFDIYEDDGTQYLPIAAFDIEISDLEPGEADVFSLDITEFKVTGSGDILTLYGDGSGEEGRMLPAYDATPRCLEGDNVCSVILPVDASSLLIYGVVDEKACPRAENNILNYDLVHEVTVVPAPNVATQRRSWGEVKAGWER